jgi:hypothetical protein
MDNFFFIQIGGNIFFKKKTKNKCKFEDSTKTINWKIKDT